VSYHTLTAALRAAFDPDTKGDGIAALCRFTWLEGSPQERTTAVVAMLLLHGADDITFRPVDERRALIGALISAGAPYITTSALDDVRSAEWAANAECLAAWADEQVIP
jgi:hypothetical protein